MVCPSLNVKTTMPIVVILNKSTMFLILSLQKVEPNFPVLECGLFLLTCFIGSDGGRLMRLGHKRHCGFLSWMTHSEEARHHVVRTLKQL